MPGINMAGSTVVVANPSDGKAVTMSPFSGPKRSPFDAKVYPSTIKSPVLSDLVQDITNYSTGALSTGLGLTPSGRLNGIPAPLYSAAVPASINNPLDDYQPGLTMPAGTAAPDARLLAIGGGKSSANTVAAPSVPVPYVAQPILNFGNGGSRDAGAGPTFTGFGMKVVTATATVANGAAIEAGFTNRQGVDITTGLSQFGSSAAASPAVT
jgi:hypothetical protein